MSKKLLIAGCILALLGVGLGAFGAHSLQDILTANGRLDTFETAVKYQFYHALAIFAMGVLSTRIHHKSFMYAGYCWILGVVIFSGSLYILSLTNIRVLGAITPIGGLLFIIGWILAIYGISKSNM